MTAIEIIALVFILIGLIKLVLLAIRPKYWYSSANPLVKIFIDRHLGASMSLILGMLVLAYLLMEMSIVQIFAAGVFFALLMMLALMPYLKQILGILVSDIEANPNFIGKNSLSIVIWIVVMIWVVLEIVSI